MLSCQKEVHGNKWKAMEYVSSVVYTKSVALRPFTLCATVVIEINICNWIT